MATAKRVIPAVISRDQVGDFWAYMSNVEDFRVVQKASSQEMRAIAWAIKGMGGDEDWLDSYTLTLGRDVYIPFEIGSGNNLERIRQVCVCCHEGQHVRQFERNPAKFVINYAFSDAARAHYEVDAYRVTMEMYYYFTGRILSPKTVANLLKGYYVDSGDIHVAEKHLAVTAKVLKQGVIVSGISKDAIRYWNREIKSPAKIILA
jgi:hypothetical protein